MPPQYRRFAPLILIALLLLVVLPLLTHHSSSGVSDKDRATKTLDALHLIDAGEQRFKTTAGHYTGHLADLVTKPLADDLAIGMSVQIDVSSSGSAYLAQVESSVLSLVRQRSGAKLVADSCLRLKSSVKCPSAPTK
jgi:hypothetical protein